MYFEASASNSCESILSGEKVLKRLVFASTHIFTITCSPNNALWTLPTAVQAKQVGNSFFFLKINKNISEITKAYVITKNNSWKIYNI